MKHLLTSIIIPAYNEEKNIQGVIKECLELKRKFPIEIIVVDDGSKDKTSEVAKKAGATKLVKYSPNKGKGHAFRQGIDKARGAYIIQIDSDHQFQPNEIPKFIELLENGYDIVLGTRFNKGDIEKGSVTKLNLFGNWLMSFTTTLFSGIKVTDIMAGFKGFKTNAARQLNLVTPHFGYEAEVIVKAGKLGLTVAEVPITYKKRPFGTSGVSAIRDGSKVSWTIIKLYFTFPGPPLGEGALGKKILSLFIPLWIIVGIPILASHAISFGQSGEIVTQIFYTDIFFLFIWLSTKSRLAGIVGSAFFAYRNFLSAVSFLPSQLILSHTYINSYHFFSSNIRTFSILILFELFILPFIQHNKKQLFFSLLIPFLIISFIGNSLVILGIPASFYNLVDYGIVVTAVVLSNYFWSFEVNIARTYLIAAGIIIVADFIQIPYSGLLGISLFFGTFISSLFLETVSFRKLTSPLFSVKRVTLVLLLCFFVILIFIIKNS